MAGITSPSTAIYNPKAICCLCRLENGSWIIDSSASDHMSFDADALYNLGLLDNPILVSSLNGYKFQVSHHGKLKLNDNLVFNHVLLVPQFKYNLLSVKRSASQL